ncbi:hypothetical protein [Candidatus Palauibacter sp.]|uniref:hypothetical protein n=1 Tax=Candidatus Palauibacter sp. TaxID=3101350 RepID=UPI003AF1E31A
MVLVGVVLFAAGCADTTRPESVFMGTLNVVVTDDGVGSPASFRGRLSADLRVSISRNGTDWISLGGPRQVDLELQSAGAAIRLHPDIDVPAGTYPYLRLNGGWGVARIEGGAEIEGRVLHDPVHLRVGDERLSIETRLPTAIFVAPGSNMTLAIDLNSEAWTSPDNLDAGRVSSADVETSLSVRAHERLPVLFVPPPERRA